MHGSSPIEIASPCDTWEHEKKQQNSGEIVFTEDELRRIQVLEQLDCGECTNAQAADRLGLQVRQIQNLRRRFEAEGALAVRHRTKGSTSPRKRSDVDLERIKKLCATIYAGFGPTLAAEKLAERDNIAIGIETLRRYFVTWKLWKPKALKETQTHRAWRPRREKEGELVQFDGSYHDWFGDGVERCLLAAIDDATGAPTKLLFEEHEGVLPVFRFWMSYVETRGKPHAIYHDRFSTYRINAKKLRDDEDVRTQFVRALQSLCVDSIAANSPQAKGRVERLFGTLQDRLVKELQLRHIVTVADANTFLAAIFLPWYRERFGVLAAKDGDAHRPLCDRERTQLSSIFSRQEERIVQNDFTIRHKNQWFQLREVQPCLVRPRSTVVVEEWTDGTLHLRLGKHELVFLILPVRPTARGERPPVALTTYAPEKRRTVAQPEIDEIPSKDPEAGKKKWKQSNNLFFPSRGNTKDKNT